MPVVSDDPAGVGPDDRLRRRVLWAMPTGLYVIGSRSGPRRNLMTANLVVQVATDPKLVAVSVEADALTCRLVDESGWFSVSLLSPEDRAVVRRFVKPVLPDDVSMDAGRAVAIRTEPVTEVGGGVPVLGRATAWFDCRVRHRLALGSHVLFVGEVGGVGGPEDTVPDVLSMRDTRMNYGG